MTSDGAYVSDTLGWLYFLAWSISFYPQVILNYQRKCVNGLSLEYQMYNITGYLFYSTYTIVAYEEQHRLDQTKSVAVNDIAFALHALILTSITIYQCRIYKTEDDTVNKYHVLLCCVFWLLALYNIVLSFAGMLPWYDNGHFSTVEFLGYIKAAISFVKYTPQVYMNWKRESTVGWSIGNIILDFTGGVLSFAQEFVDATRQNDWGVFSSNVPKLFLALESVAFDVIFLVQHYILYRDRGEGHTHLTRPAQYEKMSDEPDMSFNEKDNQCINSYIATNNYKDV